MCGSVRTDAGVGDHDPVGTGTKIRKVGLMQLQTVPNEQEKIPLLVIAGPTASGKTKLSIDLAKRFDGEIVSADSMQIYKKMTIGTAKPTPEEMDGIPHHLIDFVEPGRASRWRSMWNWPGR